MVGTHKAGRRPFMPDPTLISASELRFAREARSWLSGQAFSAKRVELEGCTSGGSHPISPPVLLFFLFFFFRSVIDDGAQSPRPTTGSAATSYTPIFRVIDDGKMTLR